MIPSMSLRGALLPLPLLMMAAPAQAGGWDTASDIGRAALVTAAAAKTVAEQDWRGGQQLGASLGVTWTVTEVLKRTTDVERPNERDDRAFPSGHASLSFSAAGYLHARYGWEWGLPAGLVAGLVGLARVEAGEHRWTEVVAGAAIGELSAFLLTSRLDEDVVLLPWGGTKSAGVTLAARF